MKKLILIALLISSALSQKNNEFSRDSLAINKTLLLQGALTDLETIITGIDEYDEKWSNNLTYDDEHLKQELYKNLLSIINIDQIIIDLFQPWVVLDSYNLGDFQSDFFDSNIIDSISVALTDWYKEVTAEDPNAIFEVTSNIEEWNKRSNYNAIPKELHAFIYPFYSKEAIMNLRKKYILYKKKYVQLSEKEVYDNFMIEKNIINIENHISSNIISYYFGTIVYRKFKIYVDNSFTYSQQKLTKNIIFSMYPDMEGCYGCVEIISTNIDSLKRVRKMEEGITSLSKENIYDKSYAIIIGIDDYQNISNLDYAVNDAESVKEMLINQFSYKEENVKLLINENANKINIEQTLSDISLLAGENDRILVFFAGHGETMKLPDGGEMGYLIPVDGRQENLYASAIPMNDLKDLSHMSKAKHMLFLVDACYGGLAAVGTRGLEPAKTPNYLEKITNIKSRQIITAGGSDEKVIEKPEWGHSAYTMNLLRALKDGLADTNGDGYITAGELGLYLNEKVTIDSENQQTPQSRRLTSHEGEFIFFSD